MTNKTDKNIRTNQQRAPSQIERAPTGCNTLNTLPANSKTRHYRLFTMDTNPNNPTRSKRSRCSRQPRRDTKELRNFEALLYWTQHSRAVVHIRAKSLEHAERIADGMSSEDIDDWHPVGGELFVESVELVQGGRDHE